MTEHQPSTAGPPPTAKQQRYLRQLALQRGVSFVPLRTRAEASRAIAELKRRAPEPVADRRREVRAVQDEMATGRGDAARVRHEIETEGYGSTAAWKRGRS
ncbi:MAG TPA: hypothetical protein VFG42_11380 [Baekduia sp.]|uniref:hypothetical protein n=1 Tax=Baekduia sp. TaxID=2600305 RepID=UPI002D79FEF3|nr:hypothetical protein [Baekduia sp.]HET6507379.1 hypothetical protein [Baekduia sp.]